MAKKEHLIPIIVSTFSEIGYRRATTAVLAERCKVQEPILYRIWPDKKAMFVDAIDYVGENNLRIYRRVLDSATGSESPIQDLLNHEAKHIGEFGNYRIVFSALPEANDPDIRQALQRMYYRIHAFLVEVVARSAPTSAAVNANGAAWGLMGLGTIATIIDALGLMSPAEREEELREAGLRMIGTIESIH